MTINAKFTPFSALFKIDAVLTLFAACQYPYLITYIDQLYLSDSLPIAVGYSAIAAVALLVSVSSAVASYKSTTNFVLIVSRKI